MPITLRILASNPEDLPTVEVTLPDTCPNPECGADFSEDGAVTEEQFQYGTQQFSFTPDGQQDWQATEIAWEGDLVLGYRCTACNWKLAGHGLSSREQAKAESVTATKG